jgi:hypothetical protein
MRRLADPRSPDTPPQPNAAPPAVAAPSPVPTPTPCTRGLCEEPTTSGNRPVRIALRIYAVVNPAGQWIQGITEADAIPVSYTVTVDATAKDEANRETSSASTPFSGISRTRGARPSAGITRISRLKGDKPGTVLVTVSQDGVRSNTVALQFE